MKKQIVLIAVVLVLIVILGTIYSLYSTKVGEDLVEEEIAQAEVEEITPVYTQFNSYTLPDKQLEELMHLLCSTSIEEYSDDFDSTEDYCDCVVEKMFSSRKALQDSIYLDDTSEEFDKILEEGASSCLDS